MDRALGAEFVSNLIIFDSEVVASALQVRHLHEVASKHCFSNIDIIIPAVKVCTAHLQVVAVHDAD